MERELLGWDRNPRKPCVWNPTRDKHATQHNFGDGGGGGRGGMSDGSGRAGAVR